MEKTFTIDWNNLEEVSKLMNSFKSRYWELKRKKDGVKSQRERYCEALEAYHQILDLDISRIYSTESLCKERKYYVYAKGFDNNLIYIKKNRNSPPKHVLSAQLGLTFVPVYIGKGCGNRCFVQGRNLAYSAASKLATGYGAKPLDYIIKDNLTEPEAFALEGKLIDIMGLRSNKTGWLCNLDLGPYSKQRHAIYGETLDRIKQLL